MDDNATRGGAFLVLISGLILTALAATIGAREAAMVVAGIGVVVGVAIMHAGLTRR
jgi:hypothetical protein